MKTRRLLFSLALGLGLTLAVLAGLGGSLPRARAATYTVTNTNASGPDSLRQAILDANDNAGHDTSDFGISGAIVLTGALPAIVDDLTIDTDGHHFFVLNHLGLHFLEIVIDHLQVSHGIELLQYHTHEIQIGLNMIQKF